VNVGMVGGELIIPNYMYRVVYRELTIKGLYGRHMFKTWELLMRLVNSGKINLDVYVGEVMQITEYGKALDHFNNMNGRAVLIP
ncbi:MAG: alcohol dehydrogenase catalytic domain-containing protein, partial [Ruminiclostridium sp.]